jgi:hypothetical protein
MDKLGKKAKDKITGFEGIITSKHIYLFGCQQYAIQPPADKDGKSQSAGYFDEGRIEILGEGFTPEEVAGEKPGCEFQEHP